MAKDKENKEKDEGNSALSKRIKKKYGDVLLPASYIKEQKRDIISVGPKLDLALNNGIPEGSYVTISGPAKFGKTSLALQIARNAQKLGRKIYIADIECRWSLKNLTGTVGLKGDDVIMIKSTKDKILTGEEFLEIIKEIISEPENEGCVMIIDSLSMLCPNSVTTSGEISGTRRSSAPKLIKDFLLQISPIISTRRITILSIQHVIANTSGYGASTMVDSGWAIQYQADVRLQAKSIKKWESDNKQIGQIVNWQIVTSALGAPVDSCESYLRYGVGIDSITELIELGSDFGIIEKAGAWYTLNFMENPIQCQGLEKTYAYFNENPESLALLENKVKEMLK